MSHDQSSFKKVAVLTGLTMLVGGAEIYEADAATVTQEINMPIIQTAGYGSQSNSDTLFFNQFNASGALAGATLTDVQFSLISNISASGTLSTLSAQVSVDSGVQIGPTGSDTGSFNFGPTEGVLSPPALSFYEGSSTFGVLLTLNVQSYEEYAIVTWDPPPPDGVTVTYTYTPATSATPLPAALPLFTTGLAGLGFATWRRRRKQKITKQA
jgi:hypothetical protein